MFPLIILGFLHINVKRNRGNSEKSAYFWGLELIYRKIPQSKNHPTKKATGSIVVENLQPPARYRPSLLVKKGQKTPSELDLEIR